MTEKRAELLLASVIIARSTSFVFNKLGLGTMSPFNLLAVRFLLAFVLLLALFGKRLRGISSRTLRHGCILGTLFFGIMSCEMFALQTVHSGTVSLLENMAILFVPLIESILTRTRPKAATCLTAVVALIGVALLTSGSGSFHLGKGECIALCSAVLYACAIIGMDRFAHQEDGFVLGILQVGILGTLALVASFVFEAPRLPQTGGEWGIILALSLVCTGFGYTLQPVAQAHTTAQRAGLFCALSPLFATIFGAVLLHEEITPRGGVGIVLILGSLLLPHFLKGKYHGDKV